MEYGNLLELIKTVSESNLSSFEYEDGATKIHMSSSDNTIENEVHKETQMDTNQELDDSTSATVSCYQNIVKSPLVGTFYVAPSEDAKPFVTVGDSVKSGQILAIVEAMKLMNDIESEFDGVVKQVFVENGQSVEYGQPLFAIG